MNWLNEQYANERYQEAVRQAQQETAKNTLLATSQAATETQGIRQAVGGKLIEWGQRLQDTSNAPQMLDEAQGL
jgi:hypothetical protein